MGAPLDTADVIVIGGGVAGLAAGEALHVSGLRVIVLEARGRVGGRIFTQRPPSLPVPIELGAEFIHGRAEAVAGLVARAGLRVAEIEGARWRAHEGRLRPLDDFWEQLDAVMKRLPADGGRDTSFERFLAAKPGGRALAAKRKLARQFVEGFHAADPHLVSAQALGESGSPGDDIRERRLGRLLDGFDRIVDTLAAPIAGAIRLSAVVSRVQWSRAEGVRVELQHQDGRHRRPIHARAAIVAVPLGVLKALPGERGAIVFTPPLDAKQTALDGLEMGSVVRIVLQMRERVWASEDLEGQSGHGLDTLSFLHADDPDVPIWWTAYPLRVPMIVGWHGGPGAARLAELAPDEIERVAVESLGRQLGISARRLRRLLVASWTHDWEHDPFARGAYSYQKAGGGDAPARLARPLAGTLFFAGEATDAEGATGTVHGAIATGRRAASAVIRRLRD